jgi:hypothetical protein
MELKHKIDKNIHNHQNTTLVCLNGKYMTFGEIAKLPKYKHLNLSGDVLSHRWKANKRTESEFLKPKRKKKQNMKTVALPEYVENLSPEQMDDLGIERPKIIEDHGYHKDKKPDEIFLGYFSVDWIQKETSFWKTKRISLIPKDKRHVVKKYPLFVKKKEALDKGFIVI